VWEISIRVQTGGANMVASPHPQDFVAPMVPQQKVRMISYNFCCVIQLIVSTGLWQT
jgi:hypothetical protein